MKKKIQCRKSHQSRPKYEGETAIVLDLINDRLLVFLLFWLSPGVPTRNFQHGH